MRATLMKTAAVALTALTLGVATIGATTPASAAGMTFHGGGFHGGWRGGGGWHGGGYRGGWRGGWGWGPFAVGAIAGAALAAPYYGGYYGYAPCVSYRPTYDAYGRYIGEQPVNTCY